jgi:hypothetical protein
LDLTITDLLDWDGGGLHCESWGDESRDAHEDGRGTHFERFVSLVLVWWLVWRRTFADSDENPGETSG